MNDELENEMTRLISLYTSGPVCNFRARDLVRERYDDLIRLADRMLDETTP